MANPNKTSWYERQRKMSCIDEHVFNTREEAEEWLKRQRVGDRKVIRSFKYGPRKNPGVKYVARVYVR